MARAHFLSYVLDPEGRPIQGATVEVRQLGSTSKITETIFKADSPDATTLSNPFTAGTDGKVDFYLDAPKRVDLFVKKGGFDDQTATVDVFRLEATTITFADSGTPVTQRSEVSFDDGLAVTDDAAQGETEVSADYANAGEVVNSDLAAEGDGTSIRLARADHKHQITSPNAGEVADTSDTEADGTSDRPSRADHVHKHGVGLVKGGHGFPNLAELPERSHSSLTGVSKDQHHAEDHAARHLPSAADPVGIPPTGSIMAYGGATAPDGWSLCDGGALSRSGESDLFGVLGTAYGAGDGSTTFNKPNLKQRFPLGKADAGTGAALGDAAGFIDHDHAVGNTGSGGGHDHGMDGPSSERENIQGGGAIKVASRHHVHNNVSQSSHVHSNPTTGARNPPFQTVNYIIKL